MWHHADVLAGTASQGQQYVSGNGVDGFCDATYGGSGGIGRGNEAGKNTGDYSAFWAPIFDDFDNGLPLSSLGRGNASKWNNYTSVDQKYQFVTPNWDGLTTTQIDQEYYYSGHSSEISYSFEEETHIEGGEMDGWETARTIVETAGVSFETTERGIIGAQRLGNATGGVTHEILEAGKLGKNIGTGLAVAGALVTVGDAIVNGPKWHHAADLAIGGGIYALSASVPVAGWIVGGAWFLTNYIYAEYHNNKSITEDLLDK